MSAAQAHPFIYGRPVRPREFLGREEELKTLFNRLRNGESTAVVGEPHIGKSSFLLKLADDDTRRQYLGARADDMIICLLDLHPISHAFTPQAFWQEVLDALTEHSGNGETTRLVARAIEAGFDDRSLVRLFTHLEKQGRSMVLFLDELDRLLAHPHFQDNYFFAKLRSLATLTGGLQTVPASRLFVADMNEKGRQSSADGSPFFNHHIEINLRPFDDRTISRLLDQTLEPLSEIECRLIRQVAVTHLQRYLTRDPSARDATAIRLALAESLAALRRDVEAADHYQKVIDQEWRGSTARTASVSLLKLIDRALEGEAPPPGATPETRPGAEGGRAAPVSDAPVSSGRVAVSPAARALTPWETRKIAVSEKFASSYVDDGDAPRILFEAAQLLRETGHTDRSTPLYRQIIERYPKLELAERSARAILEDCSQRSDRACVDTHARKFSATPTFSKSLRAELIDAFVTASFRKVEALDPTTSPKARIDAYLSFRMEFPDSRLADQALFNAADIALQAGDVSGSLKVREQLLSAYPRSPLTWSNLEALGQGYASLFEYDKAASSFERLVSSDREGRFERTENALRTH